MAIDQSYFELFRTGKEFDQIRFLDNFYCSEIIGENGPDICRLLSAAVGSSTSLYVRRSALKALCELAIAGKISNRYPVIGIISDLLSEGQDAEMQSAALKYLHYFPEASQPEFQEKLRELSDSRNGEVASQAYFCLGTAELVAAMDEPAGQQLVHKIAACEAYFSASSDSAENRVDAYFFLLFLKWIRTVFSKDRTQALSVFEKLAGNLCSRSLYELRPENLELEYLVFDLMKNIRNVLEISDRAMAWTETLPAIRSLFELRLGMDKIFATQSLNRSLVGKLRTNVVDSVERYIFSDSLRSENRRLLALQQYVTEDGLKDFIDHLVSLFPNEEGDGPEDLQLLALLSDNLGAVQGREIYQNIRRKEVTLLGAVDALLKQNLSGSLSLRTGSIQGQEILFNLTMQIRELLPAYPSEKMDTFTNILEEVIRYARNTLVDHSKKSHGFLFCQADGGKGQNAVEQDLQDNMLLYLEHSKIADGLEHEKAKFVDGGRVDIVYKKDLVTIPIELKKTLTRPGTAEMEQNYIAQAQTYTSGYDQLGIFVLLELSDKSKLPPPNFRDWFRIHHLAPSTSQPLEFPDYVVSVVIPGNRTLPSSKSSYV